jgi:hypothetical protein
MDPNVFRRLRFILDKGSNGIVNLFLGTLGILNKVLLRDTTPKDYSDALACLVHDNGVHNLCLSCW